MKKAIKTLSIFALVLALLAASGCGPGGLTARRSASLPAPASASPAAADDAVPTAAPAPSAPPAHEDVAFQDIEYAAPDMDALSGAIESLAAALEDGGEDEAALLERYIAVLDLYNAADSANQLAYLLYAMDVTDARYREEYARIDAALIELDVRMTEVSTALLERSEETEALVRERLGDGFVDAVYAGESLSGEEVSELLVADNELQMEYDELLATFSFMHNGRTWTLDEILADDTLDYEAYYALYQRYCEALNREAGGLFVELLALRAEIAGKLGYGSYAAYRYDVYGRDYSVTEAQGFHEAVKRYIVPVFIDAYTRNYDVYELYYASFDLPRFFRSFRAANADNAYVIEAFDFMQRNGLYDFDPSEKKMESSFTTYLSAYKTPFIFTQWENDASSAATVIHEFGHFMNYYYNPAAGWSSGDSLDLAEVDSQGFEFLMSPHFDELYGEAYGGLARAELYLEALYAIVTGSMEDEFQQRVYADPGMTREEMNALYGSLAVEYGMDEIYGFSGLEWVLIPHSFQSPMYYISYAVSMMAALEISERLEAGADEAWTAYLGILMREPYAAFRETLAGNGLSDPLALASVRRIAAVIDRNVP
ncbi:MAG: hypothetical protein Q4C13_01010 [Clostridia bacterium]|nr:hypothetical protein [Clostridia bacterium]